MDTFVDASEWTEDAAPNCRFDVVECPTEIVEVPKRMLIGIEVAK